MVRIRHSTFPLRTLLNFIYTKRTTEKKKDLINTQYSTSLGQFRNSNSCGVPFPFQKCTWLLWWALSLSPLTENHWIFLIYLYIYLYIHPSLLLPLNYYVTCERVTNSYIPNFPITVTGYYWILHIPIPGNIQPCHCWQIGN